MYQRGLSPSEKRKGESQRAPWFAGQPGAALVGRGAGRPVGDGLMAIPFAGLTDFVQEAGVAVGQRRCHTAKSCTPLPRGGFQASTAAVSRERPKRGSFWSK